MDRQTSQRDTMRHTLQRQEKIWPKKETAEVFENILPSRCPVFAVLIFQLVIFILRDWTSQECLEFWVCLWKGKENHRRNILKSWKFLLRQLFYTSTTTWIYLQVVPILCEEFLGRARRSLDGRMESCLLRRRRCRAEPPPPPRLDPHLGRDPPQSPHPGQNGPSGLARHNILRDGIM